MSLRENGLKRLKRAMVKSKPIVRFYVRDGYGRFTSNKIVYDPMYLRVNPPYNNRRNQSLHGKMIYVVHRGYTFKVNRDNPVHFDSINWQTVKDVKRHK